MQKVFLCINSRVLREGKGALRHFDSQNLTLFMQFICAEGLFGQLLLIETELAATFQPSGQYDG